MWQLAHEFYIYEETSMKIFDKDYFEEWLTKRIDGKVKYIEMEIEDWNRYCEEMKEFLNEILVFRKFNKKYSNKNEIL